MPWWGWLILACVVVVVAGWATIAIYGARTMARQMQADREADQQRRSRRGGLL